MFKDFVLSCIFTKQTIKRLRLDAAFYFCRKQLMILREKYLEFDARQTVQIFR